MKKTPLITLALAASSCASFGAVGYFGNFYAVLDAGSGNEFYQTTDANVIVNTASGFNTAPDGVNPTFSGNDFGTFDKLTQTLNFSGFEMNTFEDSGDDVISATVNYQIASAGGGGVVNTGSLTLNSPNSTAGNNNFWQLTTGSINLLSPTGTPLDNGDYELSISVENDATFPGGSFQMSNWEASGQPTATFSVVPEPSSSLLVGIGLVGLVARRRR